MSAATPEQLELANSYLGTWLGEKTECRLGEACRGIELVDRGTGALRDIVRPRLAAALLRKRGFTKAGMAGSGYDREPVYRKPA